MSSVIEMAITGRNPIDSEKSLELVGYLGDTENSSRTFLVRLPGSKIASFMNITSVVQSILDNSLSVTTSAVLVKEGHHWKLTISEIKFIDPTDYNASLVLENYACPVDLVCCKIVTSENGSKVGLEITFGFNREDHNLIVPDMESSEILYSPTGSEFVTFTSKKTDPDIEQYSMDLNMLITVNSGPNSNYPVFELYDKKIDKNVKVDGSSFMHLIMNNAIKMSEFIESIQLQRVSEKDQTYVMSIYLKNIVKGKQSDVSLYRELTSYRKKSTVRSSVYHVNNLDAKVELKLSNEDDKSDDLVFKIEEALGQSDSVYLKSNKLKKHVRPSWDEYFMSIAEMTATRHTCDRLAVGCVLVKDNHIIAQGYNGSISGHDHCDEADHLMVDSGCKRTIHAEMNAILMCAKLGISTKDATAYVTHYPCPDCMKHLNQAGIRKVYYKEFYKHRYENNFHDGMELIQI